MKVMNVAAAVIEKDGRLLCARRGHGDGTGRWEFPGGSIEENETAGEAAEREIREEMDARITAGPEIAVVHLTDSSHDLTVHFLACRPVSDAFHLLEHLEAEWVLPEQLKDLALLPADRQAADRIISWFAQCRKDPDGPEE